MSGLFQSAYGQLLLIKLVLFGLMLALAASNRFSLTPALATGIEDGNIEGAVLRLRRSLWLEGGAAVLILALFPCLGPFFHPPSPGFQNRLQQTFLPPLRLPPAPQTLLQLLPSVFPPSPASFSPILFSPPIPLPFPDF